jgi:hypothetical protein
MKKLLIPLGIILVLTAVFWRFGFSERWHQRFPDGWEWEFKTIGQTDYADAETGAFPDGTTLKDSPLNLTERLITASTEGAAEGEVKLTDHYTTRDPLSNAIVWENTLEATVDQITGRYTSEEYADDYFLFPQHVEKRTYHIRNTSYQGILPERRRYFGH